MEKFIKEHAPTVSINMQHSYSASLKHLSSFFKNSNLKLISPRMISQYKILRKNEDAKPATINKELAMLSKAFSLAVKEWEWIKENPVSKVKMEKENNERDRWLTQEEERRLLENSPEWLSEIIIFALNTGLRQDELLSLEWSRVDLERKTILIQKTKNGKPRTIPLNQSALNVLAQRSKVKSFKSDIVFMNSRGTKIDKSNLAKVFNKAVKEVKISNFKFHDTRHTFCTRLAQKGIDIYKIATLAGHENVRMTQRYSHHCPESLRDGVEILESDYNLTTVRKNERLKTSLNLS
jgi:integrase